MRLGASGAWMARWVLFDVFASRKVEGLRQPSLRRNQVASPGLPPLRLIRRRRVISKSEEADYAGKGGKNSGKHEGVN